MQAGMLHWRRARLVNIAAMLSLTLIGGCAGPQSAESEAAEYRRVDRELRAIDEFEALKQACRRKGGVVYVNGGWGRIKQKRPDLGTAACAMPLLALPR